MCVDPFYIYSGRRLISAPLAKNAIFKMAISQYPMNILTNRFFILSSMGPTYIDKIFNMNF